MSQSVVWISGASGGIGKAIALAFAREGASVGVGYYRGIQEAERIVTEAMQLGGKALATPCDVTSKRSVQSAYQQLTKKLGEPTVLVHAAGISQWGLFQDVTELDYDQMMNTHVRGALYMIQEGLPSLIQQKQGRIILLSSIWGSTGGAGEVLYSMAKGAINSLTQSLAKELAPSGITVNAVAPGAIKTPMLDAQISTYEKQALMEEIPLGRLGEPEEVASMVLYLSRPEAQYVTGQILHVNGGWYT